MHTEKVILDYGNGKKAFDQFVPSGLERSALQASKARDAKYHGRKGTDTQQKPPCGIFDLDNTTKNQISLF